MGSLSVPPHHDVVVVAVADAEDVRGHRVGGARLRELPLRPTPLMGKIQKDAFEVSYISLKSHTTFCRSICSGG